MRILVISYKDVIVWYYSASELIFSFSKREITVAFQEIIALRDICEGIDAIAREDLGFTLSQ